MFKKYTSTIEAERSETPKAIAAVYEFSPRSDNTPIKTSLNGTFHAFNFDKYARRYLGGHCFRFNRRFSLAEITERIANAVCCCKPCTERNLRVAEVYG